jgi:hypothetical protein
MAKLHGVHKSIKIGIKKVLRLLQRISIGLLWNINTPLANYSCRKASEWFRALNVELTEEFVVDCVHGNSSYLTVSKEIEILGSEESKFEKTEKIPVVIFAFNRPDALKQLITSLSRVNNLDRFHYFLFLDGPRNTTDVPWILASKQAFDDFKALNKTVIESKRNLGLHQSIKTGLNRIFEIYRFAIVLEDDLECDRTLLDWFVQQDQIRADSGDIGALCGYLPIVLKSENNPILKIKRFHSWGWATWSDVWNNVNFTQENLARLAMDDKFRKRLFEISPDLLPMMVAQLSGTISSWAIKFIASGVVSDHSYVFPGKSLVTNNGVNEMATHTHQSPEHIGVIEIRKSNPRTLSRTIRAFYA